MATVSVTSVNEQAFRSQSKGEVESFTIKLSSAATDDSGLNSARIFGPVVDYLCCGRVVTQERIDAEGRHYRQCSRCGSYNYAATTRKDVRSFISLAFPIINPVLAGDNGTYLATILGVSDEDMRNLCNCKSGYNVITDEFVLVNTISDVNTKDVLLQGEAAKHLIDDFNLEREIRFELLQRFKETFCKETAYLPEIGEVSREVSDIYLSCGWYLHLKEGYEDLLKRTVKGPITQEMVYEKIIVPCTRTPLMRLSLLLNCPPDKSKLYAMISKKIRVTPAGTRAEIDRRHDVLTHGYNAILQSNSLIKMLHTDDSVVSKAARIGDLYHKIRGLLILNITDKQGKRALKELISGKQGFIRKKMLGKRVDWSGRSVIVVDPTLDLDQCALPFEIAKVIYGFHLRAEKVNMNNDAEIRRALETSILPRVPAILNRAPTLHRLGILAFRVVLSTARAIGLHPLVCEGYNADFDGDTMGVHVPLSPAAIFEAMELMLSVNNIRTPASGNISIKPKQELIYGLYTLTKYTVETAHGQVVSGYTDFEEVYEGVINHSIKVYDKVSCRGFNDSAGRQALRHCLPFDMWNKVKVIDKKSTGDLMNQITARPVAEYTTYISRLLRLGFAIATLYAPTMSILDELPDEINNPFESFFTEIQPFNKEYSNGFEEEGQYNEIYSQKYSQVQRGIEDKIFESLGRDNGYVAIVESGARGDKSNLLQMFVAKGRIARTASTAFNMVIPSSFREQLSPLEHFVAAYGTRKTLIDKVHKTGDTGAAMRRMSHATAPQCIVTDDCGTGDGITLSVQEVARFLPKDANGRLDMKTGAEVLETLIIGRFEAITNKFITRAVAKDMMANQASITIRSPITCKDPYCYKCYGVDLTYMRRAVVGTPIGYIAAQAIGEPGTQLTMRTFHSGGVAGKADVTSAFDQMEGLIDMVHRNNYNKYPNYDPLAWESGIVVTEVKGLVKRVSIGKSGKKITLPIEAKLKEMVTKGEGFCVEEGNHCIHEVSEILGVKAAAFYLLMSLMSVYHSQADINIKHFEVLVSSMMRYTCVDKPDTSSLKIGESLSRRDYIDFGGSHDCYNFQEKIMGVGDVPRTDKDFLSNLTYAYLMEGLFKAHYHDSVDELKQPYNRLMFGLPPRVGTHYPDYIGQRRMELCSPSLV